jgi:hypothetical protein
MRYHRSVLSRRSMVKLCAAGPALARMRLAIAAPGRARGPLRTFFCTDLTPVGREVAFDAVSTDGWRHALVEAQVDAVLVVAKDAWGYFTYDTKVGTRHPALGGDLFAALARAAREVGVKVGAFFSVGLDHEAATRHDDWARRRLDGEKVRYLSAEARPRSCCFNTGYRERCKSALKEVAAACAPDFLFLDAVKHGAADAAGQEPLPLCYCDACQARFNKRYGVAIPGWKEALWKYRRLIRDWEANVLDYELVTELGAAAAQARPDLPVFFNDALLFDERARARMNAVAASAGAPGESTSGAWAAAAIARRRARAQERPGPLVMVAGPQARDPSPASGAAAVAVTVAEISAWACDPAVTSAAADAQGKLDGRALEEVAAALAPAQQAAGVFDGHHPVGTVWLLDSDHQRALDPAAGRGALLAALDDLSFTKYPFSVVSESDLRSIIGSEARALVVPRATYLSESEAEDIRQFVRAGGVLICSGDFSLGRHSDAVPSEADADAGRLLGKDFQLGDVMGVRYLGSDQRFAGNQHGGYLRPAEHAPLRSLWRDLAGTTPALMSPATEVAPLPGARVAARLILPVFSNAGDHGVPGVPPPPGKEIASGPALVVNSFAAGKCIYLATPYARDDRRPLGWMRAFVTRLLETFVPDPGLRLLTDQPALLNATYFRRDDELLVHVVNSAARAAGGRPVPLRAGQIVLGGAYANARAAQLLPSKRELKIHRAGKQQIVELPEIGLYEIARIRRA